jgi:hypothetical protein
VIGRPPASGFSSVKGTKAMYPVSLLIEQVEPVLANLADHHPAYEPAVGYDLVGLPFDQCTNPKRVPAVDPQPDGCHSMPPS